MTQNPINHRPCQATNRDRSLCLSSDTYVDVEYQLDSDSDRVSIERGLIYQASAMPGFSLIAETYYSAMTRMPSWLSGNCTYQSHEPWHHSCDVMSIHAIWVSRTR